MAKSNKSNSSTVFFTASTSEFEEHKTEYRKIMKTIEDLGFSVSSNISFSEFESDVPTEDMDVFSNASTYFPTMKKMASSEYVIADCTVPSMTTGHIVTKALVNKKPVLVLTKYKKNDEQNLFIFGNESPLLSYKIYKDADLIPSIKRFFRANSHNERVRMNFVVDKDISDKLEWLSFRTKSSKTDIIKQAINNYSPRDE